MIVDIQFSWPEMLGDISYDFSASELWFLQENCIAGNCIIKYHGSSFGANTYEVEFGDDCYRFKVKDAPANVPYNIKKMPWCSDAGRKKVIKDPSIIEK